MSDEDLDSDVITALGLVAYLLIFFIGPLFIGMFLRAQGWLL